MLAHSEMFLNYYLFHFFSYYSTLFTSRAFAVSIYNRQLEKSLFEKEKSLYYNDSETFFTQNVANG